MSVNGSCGHRRREFLLAGLAVVLSTSACSLVPGQSGDLDTTEVLRPVLKTARDLARAYDAAAAASNGKAALEMLRDNHSAHAEALAELLGESTKADAIEDGWSVDRLRKAEAKAVEQAVDACVGAPSDYAVLLGEIAACRASHRDVLREL